MNEAWQRDLPYIILELYSITLSMYKPWNPFLFFEEWFTFKDSLKLDSRSVY